MLITNKAGAESTDGLEIMNPVFPNDYVQIAAIELSDFEKKNRTGVMRDILEKITDCFKNNLNTHVFMDNRNYIIIFNNDKEVELLKKIQSFRERISNSPEMVMYIGISEKFYDVSRMSEAYCEVIKALQYRKCGEKNGNLIFFEEIEDYENSIVKIHLEKFKPIEREIQMGNFEGARNLLSMLWTDPQSRNYISLDVLHAEAAIIMNQILKLAEIYELTYMFFEQSNNRLYEEIYEIKDPGRMQEYIERYIALLIKNIAEYARMKSQGHMREIVEYIDQNICDADLTLTKLAKHFFMNASYLSRVLKEYLGSNFSDYCCKKRIELSMKMLLQSDSKIYEVAERVGFRDPKYFGACFKKITGMTVNEYRKQYGIH